MFDLNPTYYGLKDVSYLYLDVEYWSIQDVDTIIKDIKKKENVEKEKL